MTDVRRAAPAGSLCSVPSDGGCTLGCVTPPNHFDRSKPFYPLVMHFVAAIHGWNYLFGRGMGRMIATAKDHPAAIDATVASAAGTAKVASGSELRALAALPAGVAVLELSMPDEDRADLRRLGRDRRRVDQ